MGEPFNGPGHAFAVWQDMLRAWPGFRDVLTRGGASLVVLGHDTLAAYFGGSTAGLQNAAGVAGSCPSGKAAAFVLAKALTTPGNTRALVLKEAAGAFGRAWAELYRAGRVWDHPEWVRAWEAHPELKAVVGVSLTDREARAEYFTLACVMHADAQAANLHADVRAFVDKCLTGAGW